MCITDDSPWFQSNPPPSHHAVKATRVRVHSKVVLSPPDFTPRPDARRYRRKTVVRQGGQPGLDAEAPTDPLAVEDVRIHYKWCLLRLNYGPRQARIPHSGTRRECVFATAMPPCRNSQPGPVEHVLPAGSACKEAGCGGRSEESPIKTAPCQKPRGVQTEMPSCATPGRFQRSTCCQPEARVRKHGLKEVKKVQARLLHVRSHVAFRPGC